MSESSGTEEDGGEVDISSDDLDDVNLGDGGEDTASGDDNTEDNDNINIPDDVQASAGSRLDVDNEDAFVNSVFQSIGEIEQGERVNTVTIRDERLASVFYALGKDQHNERFNDLLNTVRAQMGDSLEEKGERSELFRRLIRIGMENATPELLEAEKEARKKRIDQDY